MLFQQRSNGRSPYGGIYTRDLFEGDVRCQSDGLELFEEHRRFLPNSPVFLIGERPLQILIHRRGRAILYTDVGEIGSLDAQPSGPYQIFGLIEALSRSTFTMSIRTITSCDFEVIPVADFLDIIRGKPDVCFKLAEILSRLYRSELAAIKSH